MAKTYTPEELTKMVDEHREALNRTVQFLENLTSSLAAPPNMAKLSEGAAEILEVLMRHTAEANKEVVATKGNMRIRGHLIGASDKVIIRARVDTADDLVKLAEMWDAVIIEDEHEDFILTPLGDKGWLLIYFF